MSQMRRLVLLDSSRPVSDFALLQRVMSSEDCLVSSDGATTAAWLTKTLGHEVIPGLDTCVGQLQSELEEFSRRASEQVEYRECNISLGPCVEYLLLLSVVGVVKDLFLLDVFDRVKRTEKVPFTNIVLVTDRGRHKGFACALERISGLPVRTLTGRSDRYLDRVLATYTLSLRSLGRVSRTINPGGNPAKAYVLATPCIASMLATGHKTPPWSILRIPESGGNPLQAFWSRDGIRAAVDAHRRAHQSARFVRDLVARWIDDMKGIPRPHRAVVQLLLDDYLETAVVSSLWAATLAVRAQAGTLSAKDARALVVGNDVLPSHRALVDAARVIGIPSIMLQHGVFAMKTMHDRPRVDQFAVWGPSGRQWLTGVGFPSERICEVGLSTLERKVRSSQTIDGRPRVLFASQPYTGFILDQDIGTSQRTLMDLAEACRIANCRLVAKAHPVEGFSRWGHEVLPICPDAELHLDTPMSVLTAGCDVLVTRCSTSVLDALAADVPVIILTDEEAGTPNPYEGLPNIDVVRANRGLDKLLRQRTGADAETASQLGETERFQSTLEWLAGPLESGANGRLIDLIERTVSASRKTPI